MITATALAALIAFTPPDQIHPVEVCEMVAEYAYNAMRHPDKYPPEGEVLGHIHQTVTHWRKVTNSVTAASDLGREFYTACMRGEI